MARQVAMQPAQLFLLYLEEQFKSEPSSETWRCISVWGTCSPLKPNATVKARVQLMDPSQAASN